MRTDRALTWAGLAIVYLIIGYSAAAAYLHGWSPILAAGDLGALAGFGSAVAISRAHLTDSPLFLVLVAVGCLVGGISSQWASGMLVGTGALGWELGWLAGGLLWGRSLILAALVWSSRHPVKWGQ